MHSPRSLFSSRAFTLIELLTVIAIIGILAAIIIPTVGAVRRNAANASDASNLRQLGAAIHLHITDNRGMLPHQSIKIPGTSTGSGNPDRWNFHEAVDRYMSRGGKFTASSVFNFLNRPLWSSRFAEPPAGWVAISGFEMVGPIAYSYNPYLLNTRWAGRSSAVPTPSQTVIVGEVNHDTSARVGNPMVVDSAPSLVGNIQSNYRVSRNGKAFYLFLDGHVSSLEGDQSESALTAASKPNIWRWWN